jgi:hypothetical protein
MKSEKGVAFCHIGGVVGQWHSGGFIRQPADKTRRYNTKLTHDLQNPQKTRMDDILASLPDMLVVRFLNNIAI